VLRNAAVNIQYKFSLASFFREANNIFTRLFWLVSILSIIFIALFTVIILAGGVAAGFMQGFSLAETSLEVFLGSFIFLTAIIFGLIIFIGWFIFAVYSVLCLVVEGKGAADTIKNALSNLKKTPQAFLFFIIVFAGALAANLAFVLIMIPLGILPLVDIVLYLMNVFFQNYLAIVVWSTLIVYYTKTTNYPVYTATYDI